MFICLMLFIFITFSVSCSNASNTHRSVLQETITNLDAIVVSLDRADKISTPENIKSFLSDQVDELTGLNRKWYKLSTPDDVLWKELMGAHGTRLLEVAEKLHNVQFAYKYRETRWAISDALSCWLFENSVVSQYAPFLFDSQTTLEQVRSIVRNSASGTWVDKDGIRNVRFDDAGLLVRLKNDRVLSVNGVPVFSARKEALELSKPGAVLSKDPGMQELHQMLKEKEDKVTLKLTKQMVDFNEMWIPILSGSAVMADDARQVVQRDLACPRIQMKIKNPNASVAVLPVGFEFLYGSDLMPLDAYLDEQLKQKVDNRLAVPANGKVRIILSPACIPYGDAVDENRALKVRHVDSGAIWVLKRPPSHDVFFQAAADAPALRAEILSVDWNGLRAGTKVNAGGKPIKLPYDYAGMEVSLKITNPMEKAMQIIAPLTIVTRSDRKVDYLSMDPNKPNQDKAKQETLEVAPNESVVVYLVSRFKKYSDWKKAGSLYLKSTQQGWKMHVKALPTHETLYK